MVHFAKRVIPLRSRRLPQFIAENYEVDVLSELLKSTRIAKKKNTSRNSKRAYKKKPIPKVSGDLEASYPDEGQRKLADACLSLFCAGLSFVLKDRLAGSPGFKKDVEVNFPCGACPFKAFDWYFGTQTCKRTYRNYSVTVDGAKETRRRFYYHFTLLPDLQSTTDYASHLHGYGKDDIWEASNRSRYLSITLRINEVDGRVWYGYEQVTEQWSDRQGEWVVTA